MSTVQTVMLSSSPDHFLCLRSQSGVGVGGQQHFLSGDFLAAVQSPIQENIGEAVNNVVPRFYFILCEVHEPYC